MGERHTHSSEHNTTEEDVSLSFDSVYQEMYGAVPEELELQKQETISQLIDIYGGQTFTYGTHHGTISDMVDTCPAVGDKLLEGVDAIVAFIDPYKDSFEAVQKPADELQNPAEMPEDALTPPAEEVAKEAEAETVEHISENAPEPESAAVEYVQKETSPSRSDDTHAEPIEPTDVAAKVDNEPEQSIEASGVDMAQSDTNQASPEEAPASVQERTEPESASESSQSEEQPVEYGAAAEVPYPAVQNDERSVEPTEPQKETIEIQPSEVPETAEPIAIEDEESVDSPLSLVEEIVPVIEKIEEPVQVHEDVSLADTEQVIDGLSIEEAIDSDDPELLSPETEAEVEQALADAYEEPSQEVIIDSEADDEEEPLVALPPLPVLQGEEKEGEGELLIDPTEEDENRYAQLPPVQPFAEGSVAGFEDNTEVDNEAAPDFKAEQDTAGVLETRSEQIVERHGDIPEEIINEAEELFGEFPEEESTYEPAKMRERIDQTLEKIELLSRATTAQECHDSLRQLRAALVELLYDLGYHEPEKLADQLLKQHDMSRLHDILRQLQDIVIRNHNALLTDFTLPKQPHLSLGQHVVKMFVDMRSVMNPSAHMLVE